VLGALEAATLCSLRTNVEITLIAMLWSNQEHGWEAPLVVDVRDPDEVTAGKGTPSLPCPSQGLPSPPHHPSYPPALQAARQRKSQAASTCR
jgi:hypothetical protein